MKTKITYLFLLYGTIAFSQSLENLKANTKKIYDANYTMDFDTVIELTYPKIYESGKPAFEEKLDSDYQNDEFRMRLEIENPVFQYSEIKKVDEKSICIITYKNPIRYFFESKLDAVTAQKKVASLKESVKAYEVNFEPKRNSINVKRNSKLVAIADDSTQNQWKFINLDDLAQREMAGKLLNENIKKELGL
ncbi:MAG TPA: hypothetical protein VK528_06020 [Flavobacterium sp.]|nr:hypothetical protein [Flavobacterium sp.]